MGPYKTIYADPPWPESGGGRIKRGADKHYPLMKIKDIMALPVNEWADENAHLYVWATNNYLHDAFHVIEAWGFRYITCITWVKEGNIGLGQYYRGMSEHLLFGVKGMVPYQVGQDGKRLQGITVLTAPRGKHSEKPEKFREMIERVSPGPYLEMFARKQTEGWDVWGNEC